LIEFSFDEKAQACYITVDPRHGEDRTGIASRTVMLSEHPMINADYREDGSLYGIEILLPKKDRR
jgi:uncharacterized protein YuzE